MWRWIRTCDGAVVAILMSINGGTDGMFKELQGGMFWSPTLRKNILSPCRPVFFWNVLNRLETAHSVTQGTKVWTITGVMVPPWPGLLVFSLPPQMLGFSPRPVHVGFAVGGVTVGQDFFRYFDLVPAFSVSFHDFYVLIFIRLTPMPYKLGT